LEVNGFRCDSMQPARVIVCEKTGQWAVALRRLLSPAGHRVYETRSWAECWDELARSPASLLALELTPHNDEALLKRLFDLTRRFPQARAIVVGERGLERYEWAVREAGATHAVFAPRRLAAAARLIERHLALAPQPLLTLRETVWRRLPWSGRRS
jgi:DNA-binding response OmpR family regulator